MKPKNPGVIVAMLVSVIGLASYQTPYHAQEERYVFVASNVNIPYWQEAQAGLTDAAKQMGVKAEMAGPEKFDPQEQRSGLRCEKTGRNPPFRPPSICPPMRVSVIPAN